MNAEILLRARLTIDDMIRHSPVVRRVRSVAPRARRLLSRREGRAWPWESVIGEIGIARLSYGDDGMARQSDRLRQVTESLTAVTTIPWDTIAPTSAPRDLDYAAVLKPPRGRERGVLLVCFEHNFMRLARHADLAKLARDYHLVVSPTWSPPFELAIMLLAARWPGRFHTMLSNFGDRDLYPRFLGNADVVPLLASSWVHPALMAPSEPRPAKTTDLVMLANFGVYKRHFALFRALRHTRVPLRARLMGVPMDGRSARDIVALARAYGVEDRVEVRESPPDAEMRRALQEARAAVILSRREGSCIAVAEMMMMDLPVLMLRDAHVGSKAFVSDATGMLVDDAALARGLEDIVSAAPSMAPRDAMLRAGTECFTSTRILNEALRTRALRQGEPWTADIVPHAIVRLGPHFVSADDAKGAERATAEFGGAYGVTIPEPRCVPVGPANGRAG